MENIIEKRTDNSSLGFSGQVREPKEVRAQKLLKKVEPHDLVRFGLIPELVGRIPVIATLDALDEDALLKILTEPKNSLVKQYKKLFELDGVEINFDEEALRTVAKKAIERKAGARGLRGIMEGMLGEIMFQTPSDPTIDRILITGGYAGARPPPQAWLGVIMFYRATSVGCCGGSIHKQGESGQRRWSARGPERRCFGPAKTDELGFCITCSRLRRKQDRWLPGTPLPFGGGPHPLPDRKGGLYPYG